MTFSAGETLNAQRNFPRALVIGSAALIGIYLLANLAYIVHSAQQTQRRLTASLPLP